MLQQILRELQASRGTVNLNELAARLGMEPSAAKGLVEFWAAKGRLRLVDADDGQSCTSACSLGNCPGAAQCPFVAKIPVSFEYRRD
jgi:hypothetical protein